MKIVVTANSLIITGTVGYVIRDMEQEISCIIEECDSQLMAYPQPDKERYELYIGPGIGNESRVAVGYWLRDLGTQLEVQDGVKPCVPVTDTQFLKFKGHSIYESIVID